MMLMDTVPADLVRQLEYHFLLGANLAILFDNSCPEESEEAKANADKLEDALRPYVDASLVIFRKDIRCKDPVDVLPEENPIGGSGLALQLIARNPQLHQKFGTLMLPIDDDEYIAMADPAADLKTLRHELLHQDDPSTAMKWRQFGSSGHVCHPTGAVVRHFIQRSKNEDEMTEEEKEAALKEAEQNNLNPPFGPHSQKFAVIWKTPEQVQKCDTHNCGLLKEEQQQAQVDRLANGTSAATLEKMTNTAGPSPPSTTAYIAHYAYQSEQHWEAKKIRGRTTAKGDREGPVPQRYNEITDPKAWNAVEEKIDNITDLALRMCLKTVFGPTPDPDILFKTAQCADPPDPPANCSALSNSQPVRIAVAFYGAQRSTPYTLHSIEENLFGPINQVSGGAWDVFIHAMIVEKLDDSSRVTAESGVQLCTNDYKLLNPCAVETHDQAVVDREVGLIQIAEQANFSMETQGSAAAPQIANADVRLNILRSRWSMKQAARLITQHELYSGVRYTHAVMARADTGFATPLMWHMPNLQGDAATNWLRVPNFQHWRGVNDRFAYGARDAVVDVLLNEFDSMNETGAWFSTGSEGKMCEYMRSHDLNVGVTPICLVRVRATGEVSGADLHVQGEPTPVDCEAAGLTLVKEGHDNNDVCSMVDGVQLSKWGWKMPELQDVLQFIHIPKNAGTTIEAIGARYGSNWGKLKSGRQKRCALGCPGTWHACSPWHMPLAAFHAKGKSGRVGSLQQTFCVVRDPVQRAISQYQFQIQAAETPVTNIVRGKRGDCSRGGLNEHIHAVLGAANASLIMVQYAEQLTPDTLGSSRTCTDCAAVADCHWLPQWLYVKDSCDHVLRFENLDNDFEKLMKRFAGTVSPATEIPGYALAREPLQQRPACDVLGVEDLDDQSIALLATIYAEDFRQLKYDLPSTPAAKRVARQFEKGKFFSNVDGHLQAALQAS